ncbi:hypothetical protein TWF694_009806 [Orbilia ellipsospora]|uniref:Pleckstrin homology domain-containing protein n=1 Tax=Orbilia ellipsospora TaxID=2528407 RepID=A0AAV9XBZ9_9PEZI
MTMDEHLLHRQSESEDGAVSDNFMPIQRMGSRNFKRHKSRSRSRNGSTSPQKMGRYTPPLTNGRTSPMKNGIHGKDVHTEEPISILDPRRFTPTLHASLVAEILSLRRDLEAKNGLIESLEVDLSVARAETENTATTAASARREARDVREQLKLRENDEELETLSYERDQALETVEELKRQVERLTKSRRKTEDDMERNRQIFDRERSEWEISKRSLEHRVHVSEGRLKTLLQEIATANEAQTEEIMDNHLIRPESIARPVSRNSMRSISSSDSESTDVGKNGIRFSMINVEASQSGLRLADELSFIHETSEASEAETEGSVYPDSVAEMSHDSMADMSHDSIPAPEDEYEPEPLNEHLIPSRRSSGALSPSLIGDDKSEITTIMAADEEELKDLRRENMRIMEMVEQLEECIRLEKQERENMRTAMTLELSEWQDKYRRQTQDYQDREYQELHEREILQREHQDQLELLESIAADTQHQLELLATEKAELKRSVEESLRARQEELDEESAPVIETMVKEMIEEVLEDSIEIEALPPIFEREEEAVVELELMKPLETPRNSVIYDDMPQSPREISANQGRKRISLMSPVPVSPPLSPPSTTRRSSAVIYISSECQTSPVKIAEPSVDAACQTDKPPSPPQSPTFIIPSIAIHPPGPSIISYEPKPTKDAGCQTFQPPQTKSSSMQTESIKVDTRILLKNFGSPPTPKREAPRPPVQIASAQTASIQTATVQKVTVRKASAPSLVNVEATVPVSPPPVLSPTTSMSSPPVPPAKSTRRTVRVPLTRLNTAPGPLRESFENSPQSSPPQRSMSEAAIPPMPVVSPNGVPRPPRSTSLWKFSDPPSDEDDDDVELEEQEDEFKTALSAPKPPRPRPSESTLASIASASNRDSILLPKRHPSIKRNIATKPILPARAWNHTVPSLNRRVSGIPVGPPYPVPLRHSSRKLPPSITSSRASSPSPMPGGIRRTRNSIRKSRSALGLKTEGSIRTRSPPPMSFSSVAPESPTEIPPLPRDAILPNSMNNKPNYGHRYQDSSVTGTASIDSSQQQTSVVDAIAQTMVGEFLYKYVRKRFGQQDSLQGWDKEDGGSGARHKRWVWVAPYERAVMWSTRQPTSGTALMGKSGRKLLIQSVLDVKDDTPPPKGVTLFNRSILILTPARALKFTAATQERHYIWLMALSFLAHSSQSPANGLTLPPALPFEYEQLANRSDVEGKGKEKATAPSYMSGGESEYYDARPTFQNPFSAHGSFTTNHSYAYSNPYSNGYSNGGYSNGGYSNGGYSGGYANDNESFSINPRRTSQYGSIISDDSVADYPTIRRHARKRSNSAYPSMPRMPPPPRNFTSPTFSGFSGTHRPSESITSDFNCNIPMHNYQNNRNSMISYNQSIRDGAASAASGNFFDAIPTGTMRMEAFIDSTPKIGGYEDDDFFPDLSRAFSGPGGGRMSNRNSRIMGPRNGFLDFYGVPDDPYSISRARYSEDDDASTYHRRGDLFAGF